MATAETNHELAPRRGTPSAAASERKPLWEQLDSGCVVHRFEWLVLVAARAIVPVLVVESDVSAQGWREAATIANWIIWAIFLGELAFIVTVAPRKIAALKAHWLEVVVVAFTLPALGSFLSSLRLVRLTRLIRLLRMGVVAGRGLRAERRLASEDVFRVVGLATLFVVVVAGAVEALVDKHDFRTRSRSTDGSSQWS